jgi:hypothetical protein
MTITSRNIITVAAATLACAAALSSAGPVSDADAATYCVADAACSGISTGGDLQQALDLAQASSRVADRVEIGPGRFVKQAGFHYDSGASAANGVTIEGVAGETVLATDDGGAGGTVLALHGTGQDTSIVSGVGLELSEDDVEKATGLRLEQASAEHVSVTSVSGAGPFGNAGIEAKHGARVRYADVQAPEKAGAGIRATGSKVTIEDVEVSGGNHRIRFDAQGSGHVSRARIDARDAAFSGIACLGCPHLDIDNSSVWVGGTAHGLRAEAYAADSTPDIDASHLTVVGTAPNAATGASAQTGGGRITVRLDNSILHTVKQTLLAVGDWWGDGWGNGEAAEIVVRNSNYAAGKSFTVLGIIDAAGVTSFGPSFVDQAGGDFHLKSSSPLIDIGRTAGVFVPSPWDLDLNDRVVDGKPGGGALPDLGAYEWHQPRQTIARAGTATPGFRTR